MRKNVFKRWKTKPAPKSGTLVTYVSEEGKKHVAFVGEAYYTFHPRGKHRLGPYANIDLAFVKEDSLHLEPDCKCTRKKHRVVLRELKILKNVPHRADKKAKQGYWYLKKS